MSFQHLDILLEWVLPTFIERPFLLTPRIWLSTRLRMRLTVSVKAGRTSELVDEYELVESAGKRVFHPCFFHVLGKVHSPKLDDRPLAIIVQAASLLGFVRYGNHVCGAVIIEPNLWLNSIFP